MQKNNSIKNFPKEGRLMALDVGTKTIGIAISDTDRFLSTPICTIYRKNINYDIGELKKLADQNDIKGMIIGLPLNMDDTESNMSKIVRDFAENINKIIKIPIYFMDERLSTFMADEFLIHNTNIKQKNRKKKVDAIAASYILESFLNI